MQLSQKCFFTDSHKTSTWGQAAASCRRPTSATSPPTTWPTAASATALTTPPRSPIRNPSGPSLALCTPWRTATPPPPPWTRPPSASTAGRMPAASAGTRAGRSTSTLRTRPGARLKRSNSFCLELESQVWNFHLRLGNQNVKLLQNYRQINVCQANENTSCQRLQRSRETRAPLRGLRQHPPKLGNHHQGHERPRSPFRRPGQHPAGRGLSQQRRGHVRHARGHLDAGGDLPVHGDLVEGRRGATMLSEVQGVPAQRLGGLLLGRLGPHRRRALHPHRGWHPEDQSQDHHNLTNDFQIQQTLGKEKKVSLTLQAFSNSLLSIAFTMLAGRGPRDANGSTALTTWPPSSSWPPSPPTIKPCRRTPRPTDWGSPSGSSLASATTGGLR